MLSGKKPHQKDIEPKVSIIIPAHNEEECIRKKIENTLALDYPKDQMEIIVGSDGSTDGTDDIVAEFSDKGVMLNSSGERVGKCSVLKRCVQQASGEIIVFTDADSTLEGNALKMVVRNFADAKIGCVEGVRRDRNEKGLMLDNLYWKYETMIKKLNSKLHAILGATGALFAVRKELYDPIDDKRGDDFELPVRVRIKGHGAVLEPEAQAYHPWLSNKDEFSRISRIVAWMLPSALILFKESLAARRWLLAFQLLTHKLLRWSVPLFLIFVFLTNLSLDRGIYKTTLFLQELFYASAFIGLVVDRARISIPAALKVPYFFCLINFASLAGIIKFIAGASNMNWKKTARQS